MIFSSWSVEAWAPVIVSVSSGFPALIRFTALDGLLEEGPVQISLATSARDGQVHTSPWLRANIAKPSITFCRKSSSLSKTSLKKTFGDLPPSSRLTGTKVLRGVLHDQIARWWSPR